MAHSYSVSLFIALLCTAMLSGCISNVETTGYRIDKAAVAKIEVGKTISDDVYAILGAPTSVSLFGEEEWFYVAKKKDQVAFYRPKIVDQEVLVITFGDQGIVSKVDYRTLEDTKNVAIAKDFTPTEGNKLTLWQQLIGNLGRFNAKTEAE